MNTITYTPTIYGDKNDFVNTLINDCTHGQIFSGVFKKRDGSFRTFQGKAWMKESVKGTGVTPPKHLFPYLDNNVYLSNLQKLSEKLGRRLNKMIDENDIIEARRSSWRSFVIDNLVELSIGGQTIKFQ
jgi:hypothetical protein